MMEKDERQMGDLLFYIALTTNVKVIFYI